MAADHRSRVERGTKTTSGSVGDVGKVSWPHTCRLTSASTSRKVAVSLRYQADTRDRNLPIRVQRLPKEGHQTVEAKEQRSRTLNGSIRPLALRLDAQMGAPFLKRHFQTPTRNFVADDLLCRLGRIGGKDRFGRALARWVTSQHPTDRQGSVSIAVPERGGSRRSPGFVPLGHTSPA